MDFDKLKQDLYLLNENLFHTPELGYKEYKTKEFIVEFLKNYGVLVQNEYSITGFSVTIGEGHPHIGLVAELDAVVTKSHPCANPIDGAAHSCGHSTQCVLMISAFLRLKEIMSTGKVSLFFTPAEEYVDLEYRRSLFNKGKIKAMGGKQDMLLNHVFDDVDVILHAHGMGESDYRYSVGSSLAGFIYKTFTFIGQDAHAAVMPDKGINALNMFSLFNTALGFMRETFVDEDKNRFHGRLLEPGNSVNTIPDSIVYESYVRSFNPITLDSLSQRISACAEHCAQSLGGRCEVHDEPGYLPLKPSMLLTHIVETEILKVCPQEKIVYGERSIAAGDIGDLSYFIPSIQLGYSGYKGRMHGADLEVVDKDFMFIEVAQIISQTTEALLINPKLVQRIQDEHESLMTLADYQRRLNVQP